MLRKVKVEAALYVVGSGTVGLSGAQAKVRLHNLKALKLDQKSGAGEYEIVNPVQFKRGEEFGYSGRVGKDGVLSDPEAEELRRMEQAETTEQAVRAAVAAARDKMRQESAQTLEAMRAELRAELEPKLRAEIEEKVRAELAAKK